MNAADFQSTATRSQEIGIHLQATAIRSRASTPDGLEISIDIRATTADRRETAIDWSEIAIYTREIAADIREIDANTEKMAANIEEIRTYIRRIVANNLEKTVNTSFSTTSDTRRPVGSVGCRFGGALDDLGEVNFQGERDAKKGSQRRIAQFVLHEAECLP